MRAAKRCARDNETSARTLRRFDLVRSDRTQTSLNYQRTQAFTTASSASLYPFRIVEDLLQQTARFKLNRPVLDCVPAHGETQQRLYWDWCDAERWAQGGAVMTTCDEPLQEARRNTSGRFEQWAKPSTYSANTLSDETIAACDSEGWQFTQWRSVAHRADRAKAIAF